MTLFPAGIPISKRVFDLLASSTGLVLASPFLIFISIAILASIGQPVFFRQKRPGYLGKPFFISKFRTMAEKYNSKGDLLPDAERLTRFGRLLRTMSIDELPELLNIIRGEMSIVGPRPLLMQYLERYSPEQARRHNVHPGMTGWAQVNGRNAISWEDKFRYDVWYIDHWSFWLDMKIIALSFWKVLQREGIDQPGRISAGEFMGTDRKPNNQNMNG